MGNIKEIAEVTKDCKIIADKNGEMVEFIVDIIKFPYRKYWIGKKVGDIIRTSSWKECTILKIEMEEKEKPVIEIRTIKNGDCFYAKTHAEFLNQAFGTNYNSWMRCVWQFNDDWIVWMVRFNELVDGWRNTFISDTRIKEEDLRHVNDWKEIYKKRFVIEIEDLGYTRRYTCRGRYIYDEENSNTKVRYYNKYSD